MRVEIDAQRVTRHMSESIRFPTVSTGDPATQDYQPFREFLTWVEATYREVYETMEVSMVADYTILLKWQGQNDSLKPVD